MRAAALISSISLIVASCGMPAFARDQKKQLGFISPPAVAASAAARYSVSSR
jgi:hypothetical protein